MIVLSKDRIESLLVNYRVERESIDKLLSQLQTESELLLFPAGGGDNSPVQHQFSQTALIESLLKRCDDERLYYRQTLQELREQTRLLDLLMCNVNRLPGHQRLVVLDVMIGGESVSDYARRNKKGESTVRDYKTEAVSQIYERMTVRPIESAQYPEN